MGIKQSPKIRQGLCAVVEVADRKFAKHDGMRDHFAAAKKGHHFRERRSKMGEPDRCIHEDEHGSVLREKWTLPWREFEIGHGAAQGG